VQLVLALQLPVGATARDARDAARAFLAAGEAGRLAIEAAGGTLAVRQGALPAAGSPMDAALDEIPWEGCECAIFGQPAGWDSRLQPGDRVEVLRPLRVDPRASRRRRVAEARRQGTRPAGPPEAGDG
jgi:putative ubiquitin-RnfH superfamily antitoxin RatB of RatAB toxin-antitoxin module